MQTGATPDLPGTSNDEAAESTPQNSQVLGWASVSAQFAGPLPPPAVLAGYEEVCPGAAERILKGFEEERRTRLQLERNLQGAQIRAQTRGTWLGFILALTSLGAAVGLTLAGHGWTGAVIGASGPVGIVVTYVATLRRNGQVDEQE